MTGNIYTTGTVIVMCLLSGAAGVVLGMLVTYLYARKMARASRTLIERRPLNRQQRRRTEREILNRLKNRQQRRNG